MKLTAHANHWLQTTDHLPIVQSILTQRLNALLVLNRGVSYMRRRKDGTGLKSASDSDGGTNLKRSCQILINELQETIFQMVSPNVTRMSL